MKKTLQIIILTIITSFIFSSCSNKLSITKRKYNKGYYVSHSHKKNPVKDQQSAISIKHKKQEVAEIVVVNPTTKIITHDKNDVTLSASATKPIENNSTSVKDKAISHSDASVNKKYYKVKQLERFLPTNQYTQELKKNLSADSHSDDALSLLWIVIVVVLLLYLLGLLFGGFGLGGAIHVLAVIFLVLLILWLLRII